MLLVSWSLFVFVGLDLDSVIRGLIVVVSSLVGGFLHLVYDSILRRSILLGAGIISLSGVMAGIMVAIEVSGLNGAAAASFLQGLALVGLAFLARLVLREDEKTSNFVIAVGLISIYSAFLCLSFGTFGALYALFSFLIAVVVLGLSIVKRQKFALVVAAVGAVVSVGAFAARTFDGVEQVIAYMGAALILVVVAVASQSIANSGTKQDGNSLLSNK